jgi:hypothetical protein
MATIAAGDPKYTRKPYNGTFKQNWHEDRSLSEALGGTQGKLHYDASRASFGNTRHRVISHSQAEAMPRASLWKETHPAFPLEVYKQASKEFVVPRREKDGDPPAAERKQGFTDPKMRKTYSQVNLNESHPVETSTYRANMLPQMRTTSLTRPISSEEPYEARSHASIKPATTFEREKYEKQDQTREIHPQPAELARSLVQTRALDSSPETKRATSNAAERPKTSPVSGTTQVGFSDQVPFGGSRFKFDLNWNLVAGEQSFDTVPSLRKTKTHF